MADDPTPPPVPAEPYPGATEVRKLALNTFWPMVQDRADELGLESTADGIDSRLLVAINRGLYAAGAAIWAAGRTAASADLAATFERTADSEGQSLLGTPPEYPSERTMRSGRCAAFKRAAEIAREAPMTAPDAGYTPDPAARDTDELPPTQYLICEVLAARYRTGEATWTFPVRFRSHVEQLADIGLIGWKSGVAPRTVIAWLTEVGQKAAMGETYDPPGGQWEWAVRLNSLRGRSSILPRDDEEHARLFFAEPAGAENAEPVRRWVGPWLPAPTNTEESA